MSTPQTASRLQNFPISWFAVIMGMAGFSVAWNRAEHILHLPFTPSPVLRFLTVVFFLTLTVLYGIKIFRYPASVLAEINHPVKIAFLPTFSISLLLLSIMFAHSQQPLSQFLWAFGTFLHFCMTLYILSSWIHQNKYEIKHLNPAWFIPVVGNILVPVVGVQYAAIDVSWFFFSVGLFFWPVLTAIIFYRLIFHQSLPDRFMPTLFIFIAPPSVASISLFNLTGALGEAGRIFYFIALFFFILVTIQAKFFLRCKFFLSWWAYSFPVAALTIATLLMAKESGAPFYTWLSIAMLATLTALIATLLLLTVKAIVNRTICTEDDH
jgi:tellurite resistance protein